MFEINKIINSILEGDATDVLSQLPDESINCCVTSPPYFGLRDYKHPKQIGLEKTPEQYIDKLVQVFRQVKRVLKKDGTLWVNIGDSYARTGGTQKDRKRHWDDRDKNPVTGHDRNAKDLGLKSKDLIGIPWMLAFALRADGWYLRQDIIWSKPNPMPESVTDRCTKSHEYIFLLSKSEKYYYDQDSIKEKCSQGNIDDFLRRKTLNNKGKGEGTYQEARPDLSRSRDAYMPSDFLRNKRSVWTVGPKPFKNAHFATFPVELIAPCILAGCPKDGIVLDPFGGSGTTGEAARTYSRNFILIELNNNYINDIAKPRVLPHVLSNKIF